MKNQIFFNLKNKVKLNIKGKNIINFIKRINNNKINIYNIKYISRNEAYIIILETDYKKIEDLKTIYEVSIVDIYGIMRLQEIIKKYKYLLIFFVIGLIIIYFLSNVIFSVKIISLNKDLNNELYVELENHGIKKYTFKKSYHDIQLIKEDILKKYKDSIEWLEIENIGTNYTIKLQERIIINKEDKPPLRNLIALKNAIIKKIIADEGSVLKEVNEYVLKGDVIVSGEILVGENVKNIVSATGSVYGEVWYNVSVEYPYVYEETSFTGNTKEIYSLYIFNKNIDFTLNKYKSKVTVDKLLLKSNILPIKFVKQKQLETDNIFLILTPTEAINRSLSEAVDKIETMLDSDEEIIDYCILKTDIKDDKVVVDIFFSVLENITSYVEIEGD